MKAILITVLFFASFVANLADTVFIENNVSSSANTGRNTVSPGGAIVTGEASASVSVHTEINGSAGTTTVKAEATANEKTETVVKEVSGADVSMEIKAEADSSTREYESASTSIHVEHSVSTVTDEEETIEFKEEQGVVRRVAGMILSVLKSSFAYVLSIFL